MPADSSQTPQLSPRENGKRLPRVPAPATFLSRIWHPRVRIAKLQCIAPVTALGWEKPVDPAFMLEAGFIGIMMFVGVLRFLNAQSLPVRACSDHLRLLREIWPGPMKGLAAETSRLANLLRIDIC